MADEDVDEDRLAALALLRVAGLSPSAAELPAVLANYAGFRHLAETLYAVPEARYEEPAIIFDPYPTVT